jgi:hypothetical protein
MEGGMAKYATLKHATGDTFGLINAKHNKRFYISIQCVTLI